jgi:hypothetical protein
MRNKLKDRALEVIRQGIDRAVGKPDADVVGLQKRVPDLWSSSQREHALATRGLNKL